MPPPPERSTNQQRGEPHHQRALAALARRGRLRALTLAAGMDFTSNDYLGLAASPELAQAAIDAISRGVPLGAGGSRLLRGNHAEHEALEREAASFFGAQTALYFGSGFAANATLIATLPARGDLIVHDELIHASAWEGMALTKAETASARHNDCQAFEDAIVAWRARGGTGQVWIAIESLYSMDGDQAPLAGLAQIAARHDAMLLIDEAHATGVLGQGGQGLGASLEGSDRVVALHTCGKALGAVGALITAPASIRDFLINRSRAFVYATAPSPVMAAVVRRSLELVRDEPQRRTALAARVAFAGQLFEQTCGVRPSGSQILPVIVGSDTRAVAIAQAMQRAGYDIRAIRPPTVPEGTARLRITVTLNADEASLAAMFATLDEALKNWPRTENLSGAGLLQDDVSKRAHLPDADEQRSQDIGAPISPALPSSWRRPGPTPTASDAPTRFVVTGTGTGVGKTVFAAALTAALDGDYWKPIQSGLDGPTDTQTARELSGLPAERFHAEAYRLRTPVSPHTAAEIDGVSIDPCSIIPPATTRPLVIEGAGGLMVPITPRFLMIDLFQRWNLPVILVASTGLGTINHTLLSIEALRARDIPILGVAFIGAANADNESYICIRYGVRWLGRLPHLPKLDSETLAQAFDMGFPDDTIPGLAGKQSPKLEGWRAPS